MQHIVDYQLTPARNHIKRQVQPVVELDVGLGGRQMKLSQADGLLHLHLQLLDEPAVLGDLLAPYVARSLEAPHVGHELGRRHVHGHGIQHSASVRACIVEEK